MDFEWTPQHVAYRKGVKKFLADNLPPDWDEKSKLDPSDPYIAEFAMKFCPAMAKAGYLIPHWPKEVGGGELDPYHHWILGEEMFAAGEPRAYQYMNVNWIGPAILQYGNPAQIEQHVKRITAGTVYWCQGFSEPDAGSDAAMGRTTRRKSARGSCSTASRCTARWAARSSTRCTSGLTGSRCCRASSADFSLRPSPRQTCSGRRSELSESRGFRSAVFPIAR